MTEIKAILFDNTGVMMDRNHQKILEDFYKVLQIKNKSTFLSDITGKIEAGKESIEEAFSVFETDTMPVEKVIETYSECYMRYSSVREEMVELVKKLKSNYKVYSMTRTNSLNFSLNKKTGVFDIFDGVFTSFKIGYKKPDERAFEYVIKELKIDPENIVFIDDLSENVDSARQLGIKAILFEVYEKLIKDLKKLGVKI